MKRVNIVLITLAIETILLWFVSHILGWMFIDTVLLGGVIIFGIKWLFSYFFHQEKNQYNANIKGWTGQEAGEIKPFEFNMSSIDIALLLFIVASLLITIFAYSSYLF